MPSSILIADDYADNRELLRLMLSVVGYEIREARDGRECIRMALAEPPDLLLIDLSMPVLDGWDVLRELRADERTRAIPCVAFTAIADLDHERALAKGFDAYLAKPFNAKDLLLTVERLLARHADRETEPNGR
jgi:CheY-like chemotaxis protein